MVIFITENYFMISISIPYETVQMDIETIKKICRFLHEGGSKAQMFIVLFAKINRNITHYPE